MEVLVLFFGHLHIGLHCCPRISKGLPALPVPLFLGAQTSLQTGVSTALPIIVDDLKGTEFLWAGSAYALAATAFIPFNGGLAEVTRMRAKVI